MYNFRYFAMGHSYLKHGPFEGWQTKGFWGMAASEPSKDYFHRFCGFLKENFDCTLDAFTENYACYERLCVYGATKESYVNSKEYASIKNTLIALKPNIITVFLGGGNTVANDKNSLTLFYKVLFELISKYKQPETVTVFAAYSEKIKEIAEPIVKKFGFILADVSFIHSDSTRNNPYYAFADYPEYDENIKHGAVEFRTHPNDFGHLKIAESIFTVAKNAIKENILNNGNFFDGCWQKNDKSEEKNDFLGILTTPKMNLKFSGFNIAKSGDCIEFSSAPGTGAAIIADNLHIKGEFSVLFADLQIKGDTVGKKLNLSVTSGEKTERFSTEITGNNMQRYIFDISKLKGEINAINIKPEMRDCYIKIKSLGLEK